MAKKTQAKGQAVTQHPKVVVFPCKSMFDAKLPNNVVYDNPIELPCSKRARTYKHVRKVGV
jgi:hypothetical protein